MSGLFLIVRLGSHRIAFPAAKVESVATNIVVLDTGDKPAAAVARAAAAQGVLVSALGRHTLRAVTHLDVTTEQCVRAGDVLGHLLSAP